MDALAAAEQGYAGEEKGAREANEEKDGVAIGGLDGGWGGSGRV